MIGVNIKIDLYKKFLEYKNIGLRDKAKKFMKKALSKSRPFIAISVYKCYFK